MLEKNLASNHEGPLHHFLERLVGETAVGVFRLDVLPGGPLEGAAEQVEVDHEVGADGDAREGHAPDRVVGGVNGGVRRGVLPLVEDGRDLQKITH